MKVLQKGVESLICMDEMVSVGNTMELMSYSFTPWFEHSNQDIFKNTMVSLCLWSKTWCCHGNMDILLK